VITKRRLAVLALAAVLIASVSIFVSEASGRANNSTPLRPSATTGDTAKKGGLPPGVTLRQIDGGSAYFASLNPSSAWMDRHILLGAWLEEPQSAVEVGYDAAMGDNIYWNLAATPGPDRADYNVIRAGGMHVSAPDTTANSGSETVAYEGSDEADMDYGPGWSGWDAATKTYNTAACEPAGSRCGYTVARFFYTLHPVQSAAIHQGFGKGVLFWETASQAAKFLQYSDTLSADSYWMTDPSLGLPSQGGCALLPASPTACGGGAGSGLTAAERALPANYAYNVKELERLQAPNGPAKPVVVDVETGCPLDNSHCTTPADMTASAWQALIAGARGIIWFQHNFSGPCVDFRSFVDGSNPAVPMYHCQQTPGVTLHDMVEAVASFNHEVTSLNAVLLSPFAEGYVRSPGDVSTMAKWDGKHFYIFSASGRLADPPVPNQRITFHLAGAPSGEVTVVGENRSIPLVDGSFTDLFSSDTTVHVYEVNP
jgi:hypothetical protein